MLHREAAAAEVDGGRWLGEHIHEREAARLPRGRQIDRLGLRGLAIADCGARASHTPHSAASADADHRNARRFSGIILPSQIIADLSAKRRALRRQPHSVERILSPMWFVTETLANWDEIHRYARHERSDWLYRGQKLPPGICRLPSSVAATGRTCRPWKRAAVEAELFREFRRAYHQYARHVPQSDAVLEWLSLMQHHGAPSRLLDFTLFDLRGRLLRAGDGRWRLRRVGRERALGKHHLSRP